MDSIAFSKMSGCGNDFVIIDNRNGLVDESNLVAFVTGICRRRMSVGADGVILIEDSPTADFAWRFFNADGSRAEMCGNGARCAARFALMNGIAGARMSFETDVGRVHAQVEGRSVKVKMTDPHGFRRDVPVALSAGEIRVGFIDTGVPHAVAVVADLEAVDVLATGREIRRHAAFGPSGTNADFIRREPAGGIAIRTYERGVEGETLACGTGAVAGALVAADRLGLESPVPVRTRSGEVITVFFRQTEGGFGDVHQQGSARLIYTGALRDEAWR